MKPPFVNWASLFSVGGLGILFWQDVIDNFLRKGIPSLTLPPEMLQILLFVSLALISAGTILFAKSGAGPIFDRLWAAIGFETWQECAGLFSVAAWFLALVTLIGSFVSGELGAVLQSAIVPATFAAAAGLMSFAGLGVDATNTDVASTALRWVLSVCWVFSFGGIVTLTVASLFMWLPISVILTLACIVAFTIICTWLRFRKDEPGNNQSPAIRRLRKVGLYQAGLVPLVALGAVTFSSGQLAPIYLVIGLVTMTLGIRKISQTFAE